MPPLRSWLRSQFQISKSDLTALSNLKGVAKQADITGYTPRPTCHSKGILMTNAGVKKTILIVDDDNGVRAVIRDILESLGYEVLSFESGREALATIVGRKIDLVLLDVMMPEIPGYDLLKELRKLVPQQQLPVIMMSAMDDPDEVIQGFGCGADHYITKPFTSVQLATGVKLFIG